MRSRIIPGKRHSPSKTIHGASRTKFIIHLVKEQLTRKSSLTKHFLVPAIPITLKHFVWIMLQLQLQKFLEVWITSYDLLLVRNVLVCQIECAVQFDRTID
jgi:hypothetical protein